jgi:hypothetical protein
MKEESKRSRACVLLGFVGVLVAFASPAHAGCSHWAPSLASKTICTACAAFGPVAQNEGSICTWQATTAAVFCDCAGCRKCLASGGYADLIIHNFSGLCANGVCTNPVETSPNEGYMNLKTAGTCTSADDPKCGISRAGTGSGVPFLVR